uniref:Nidogen 1a n=1 Tax=Angiostrongylus cantonensis TaxID=6313 RepID=A0A158P9N2_ANGCA
LETDEFVFFIVDGVFFYSDHRRYKRQLTEPLDQQHIDLNITVPYIFSARLYPYGESKGDLIIRRPIEVYKLANPFHYLGQVYDTIYIHSSGVVTFNPNEISPAALPVGEPVLAAYWMNTEGATVYYRETDDANTLNLAHNEVNIQYRYGSIFHVKSVVIITWDGGRPENSDSEGNLFQLGLIIGDSMTFAHIVYSKLNSNDNAVAGFASLNSSYSLPDSATHDAMLLSEKSDIGIPGEWLFRIDGPKVYLCGAGFKGIECIDSCAPSQWFNDCSRNCHCDGGDPCDQETGRCPNGRCSPGWKGAPICDEDVDECELRDVCPSSQPDCMNTPGSYLCICFEYDDCVDVDECAESAVCGANSQCVNRPGSYDCVCDNGYRFIDDACLDIDECQEDAMCGEGQGVECLNRPGSYECKCKDGFNGDPRKGCFDVDECASGLQYCGQHTKCINTVFILSHSWIVVVVSLCKDIKLPCEFCAVDEFQVSSNGVLSFNRPLPGLIENAESLHEAAVFALHAQYDYVREGLVAYTCITGTKEFKSTLLSRSSISVQNNFKIPTFRTKTLHLFTFDRMRQAGSENLNSFQIALAQSDEITMLTLIYEKTQSRGPMTGISSPTSFHFLPNDLLSTQSNVGQPGKWMFRIDDVIGTCPAGREHPPLCDKDCPSGQYGFFCESRCRCAAGFPCDTATGVCANGCASGWTGRHCDQDVDECVAGVVSCGPNAECVNTAGGYECRCQKGYSGDGKLCSLAERCYSRFGRSCSANASCEENPDGPRCVCGRGYRGDGFVCLPQPHIQPSIGNITELLNWQMRRHVSFCVCGRRLCCMICVTDRISLSQMWISVVFLIGPAVLCAIWVILVIVVIAVCCRNKTRWFRIQKQSTILHPMNRFLFLSGFDPFQIFCLFKIGA